MYLRDRNRNFPFSDDEKPKNEKRLFPKKPTYKTFINHVRNHYFSMSSETLEFFGDELLRSGSDIELMLRIFEFEKTAILNHDDFSHCIRGMIRPLQRFENIKKDIIYNFPFLYYKNNFYETYPQFIKTNKTELELLSEKIKTLEQYQAQILDKLSVFTEMIDELQCEKNLKINT